MLTVVLSRLWLRWKGDTAASRARKRLRQERFGRVRVDHVFYYGAIQIDPSHLVVWVLLSGAPPEELPRWWATDDCGKGLLPYPLEDWLSGLTGVVREEFARVRWPRAGKVDVAFDSTQRVQESGWDYFR